MNRQDFERDPTQFSYWDFRGSEPPMLLHGLAGTLACGTKSARLLCTHYPVFALDQRGHGDGTRRPLDLSRNTFV